jgi:hypothetical protein
LLQRCQSLLEPEWIRKDSRYRKPGTACSFGVVDSVLPAAPALGAAGSEIAEKVGHAKDTADAELAVATLASSSGKEDFVASWECQPD